MLKKCKFFEFYNDKLERGKRLVLALEEPKNIYMRKKQTITYDDYVIRGVLANNDFDINEVNEIKYVKTMSFLFGEYPSIKEMIQKGELDKVIDLPSSQEDTIEILDITTFSDQHKRMFIVTIYDSLNVEQDPQIIEIFPF